MTDLLTRLEALDGPDREVDAEICALDPRWEVEHPNRYVRTDYPGEPDGLSVGPFARNIHNGIHFEVPRYTGSLDAALTLVPEGWHWSVYDTDGLGRAQAQVEPPEYSFDPVDGIAATPAIALCIAALRAIEAHHD